MRIVSIIVGFILAMTLVIPAFAQQSQINETYLVSLYANQLRSPQNASVVKQIETERKRIRALAEGEIKASIPSSNTPVIPSGQSSSETVATGSIEAQRKIVDGLQTSIQGWEADLSVLKQEEEIYYLEPSSQTGSDVPSRQTKSHQELLAKKAVTEERIAAGTSILALENDRLSALTRNARLEQFSVFFSLGFYFLIFIVIMAVERLLRSVLFSRIADRNRRYTATKIFAATVYILTSIWLINRILSEYPDILTTLAILGAGITFALQDTVKDIVGWVLILQKRLFALGDRVQIVTYVGEVIDISILRTTFLEVDSTQTTNGTAIQDRTGKTFFLPNSMVLSQRVMNYNTTSDYMKAELPVSITYESDWRKAEEILKEILDEEAGKYGANERQQHNRRTRLLYVPYEPGSPRVFLELGPSGVHLLLRFTIPIESQREVLSRISKKILERFETADIDLAYNTVRSISTAVEPHFFGME